MVSKYLKQPISANKIQTLGMKIQIRFELS